MRIFLTLLKQHVGEVLFLEQDERVGLDSIYAHDPVKFTSQGAIILKSGKALRQPEATDEALVSRYANMDLVRHLHRIIILAKCPFHKRFRRSGVLVRWY